MRTPSEAAMARCTGRHRKSVDRDEPFCALNIKATCLHGCCIQGRRGSLLWRRLYYWKKANVQGRVDLHGQAVQVVQVVRCNTAKRHAGALT
jgi:hypothetical protein